MKAAIINFLTPYINQAKTAPIFNNNYLTLAHHQKRSSIGMQSSEFSAQSLTNTERIALKVSALKLGELSANSNYTNRRSVTPSDEKIDNVWLEVQQEDFYRAG